MKLPRMDIGLVFWVTVGKMILGSGLVIRARGGVRKTGNIRIIFALSLLNEAALAHVSALPVSEAPPGP